MDFRIISLPPFTAATSGPDPAFDFSPTGVLGKFNAYFSAIQPAPRDSFMPRDFLFFDREKNALEWWWALEEGMPDGGYQKIPFDGGVYLTYFYWDQDEEENGRLYQKALKYIHDSPVFELDERPGHYAMGHIITPPEAIQALGRGMMEAFVPVKLKNP
ncbi:hypothetical protein D5272_06540 [bacterium D16-76]|nr:hypothetical protein [bacterium D16-76]